MLSLLSKAVYALVLQCSKLRGAVSRAILGFIHSRDRLIVTHFYRPCPLFRRPVDYFRTTEVGLCWPERTKAFSQHGSRKKMLTWYSIILQSLAHSSAFLSVTSVV